VQAASSSDRPFRLVSPVRVQPGSIRNAGRPAEERRPAKPCTLLPMSTLPRAHTYTGSLLNLKSWVGHRAPKARGSRRRRCPGLGAGGRTPPAPARGLGSALSKAPAADGLYSNLAAILSFR